MLQRAGVRMNRCLVCGVVTGDSGHTIGPGQYVCLECEIAKGNWEDARLDDYGRLVKR